MLKDIPQLVVEDIAMAVVPETNREGEKEWNVYLINLKNELIEGVLVTSKGYGYKDGEKVKTSTLRHFLDEVPPKSYIKVEPIIENVFVLNNEYWLSFYINKTMYDKKYLFLPGAITPEYFTKIPLLEKEGVMIK
jgi:hypothetical protein